MQPLIIAHRGASYDAPENTLAAFNLGWQQQADGIEGDFQLSADGEIVCIHDSDTARTGGVALPVDKQPLAKLRQLDVGSWHSSRYRGERIPTLTEVLATIPTGAIMEIDIKCGTEIIPPLLATLKKSTPAAAQIVCMSFRPDVIAALKAQFMATGADYQTRWLIDFSHTAEAAATTDIIMDTLRQTGADSLGTCPNIPPALKESIITAGYPWCVWTVDDPVLAREQQGATFITTNVPAVLREEVYSAGRRKLSTVR